MCHFFIIYRELASALLALLNVPLGGDDTSTSVQKNTWQPGHKASLGRALQSVFPRRGHSQGRQTELGPVLCRQQRSKTYLVKSNQRILVEKVRTRY